MDWQTEHISEKRLLYRLAIKYGELLTQVSRSGGISPRFADYRIRAGVPELLIAGLIAKGASNVSELARWMRQQRGRASRDKIRRELGGLVDLQIVRFDVSARRYALSPNFLASYLNLLLGSPANALELLEAGWADAGP